MREREKKDNRERRVRKRWIEGKNVFGEILIGEGKAITYIWLTYEANHLRGTKKAMRTFAAKDNAEQSQEV
jgi:hypothetical protein